jgi:hypothetical protein
MRLEVFGYADLGAHFQDRTSANSEQILLVDTDQSQNALLDLVTFGAQETDRSWGRKTPEATTFEVFNGGNI